MTSKGETSKAPAVACDIGTMWIIGAKKQGEEILYSKIRDCFFELEKDALSLLTEMNYFQKDGNLFAVGEDAMKLANLFRKEVRRPLSAGIISPHEIEAIDILYKLLEQVLGKSQHGELCCFSVPAPPIDSNRDIIYHTSVFSKIVAELGYRPKAINEAFALVFSECAKSQFSGLTFSWGAGMVNCSLTFKTIPILQFSLGRGGDWIDSSAAAAIGKTAARMCLIKESEGFDLTTPRNRDEEVLSVYYKSLIKYALDNVVKEFVKAEGGANIDDAIPIVLAGGTTMVKGFVDMVKIAMNEEYKNFPIKIKDIVHASEPLTSVSKGLLIYALNEAAK